jgi:hypothetical protein
MTDLTRINLIKQIEEVLDEYSGHIFQRFFRVPHRKEQLVNEVINKLPNSYCVIEKDATTEAKRVHCWALEQRLTLEMLIRESMNKLFLKYEQQDQTHFEVPKQQPLDESINQEEPSHWFG